MVPPKNGFLSLRLPIFGSSYYQCFYTFGIAPCSVGIFGIGIPHIGRSRGSYFQLSRQKPDQNQFIVWKKHTGDLKSEHSIEENYFDPATVQIQSIGMQKWWESGHTYIHSLELGCIGFNIPSALKIALGKSWELGEISWLWRTQYIPPLGSTIFQHRYSLDKGRCWSHVAKGPF